MHLLRLLRVTIFVLPAALVARTPPAATTAQGQGAAQSQPPAGRGGAQGRGQGRGPNFPQQQRPLADAAVLARGKGLYESSCSACHGIDLRGGQQGGPNLLRSQTLLSDKGGELVIPIVRAGRPSPPAGMPPMPAFPFPDDDIKAIAEYLHGVLKQAGNQGRPPGGDLIPPERILVGDAAAGQAYFNARCGSCHAVTGDLQHVASRAADPRELQNLWLSGGSGGGRGGRGRGASPDAIAVVTTAQGQRIEGRLVRIDDFVVSVAMPDGTRRTFARNGADPTIEVRDPSAAHRTLVPTIADQDMHDVTAYLWTIK
jgi:cytochrome c oxidase cbb3-type subunit 3